MQHLDGLEPLNRSRPKRWWDDEAAGEAAAMKGRPAPLAGPRSASQSFVEEADEFRTDPPASGARPQREFVPERKDPRSRAGNEVPVKPEPKATQRWLIRRGHTVTYLGIFLFTFVLYFRPYELIPGLEAFSSLALVLAAATLAVYLPAQIAVEGNLTSFPPEVKLVLLLTVAAAISIPFGLSPGNSWANFSETFVKAVMMFIVIVNVARTELRLKGLIWLALAVGVMLSINAMVDYHLGKFANDGYRVDGTGHGMFGNPYDMALHLVVMTPIALALLFAARNYTQKLLYGLCALLFVAGNVITFSRGGFLGLMVAMGVLVWKAGRGKRVQVSLVAVVLGGAFLVLAPGNYGLRIASIFIPSLDPVGSSTVREGHLIQSILVTLRHPLTGLGMGNFSLVSNHGQVTHNAFTQISSEMGVAALLLYVAFMVYPLWRLYKMETESHGDRSATTYYYLSIGLQAGIVGYMVSSFFAAVAYQWYIYYLVGYAICLRRIYRSRPVPAAAPERRSLADLDRPRVLSPGNSGPGLSGTGLPRVAD